MSTTNEAFIKAYRTDAAATPRPVHAVLPSVTAACQTSVEFVSLDYAAQLETFGAHSITEPSQDEEVRPPAPKFAKQTASRATSKRPLSSYLDSHPAAPPMRTAAEFTPETIISAFHWPRVCRALWNDFRSQFDQVAETLLAHCAGQRSLIGLAGVRPGDGCTTNLLCLTMSLAAHEASVIVVDANFAAPRLAHRLGVEPTTTWQDVLAHGLPVADAVIRSADDHVDLLPLAGHTFRAEELAAGLQPAVTAGVLRHAYQIALVDLGAILDDEAYAATDPLIRNMRLDGAIIVTDVHRSDAAALADAGELLRENDCPLIGAIENRVRKTPTIIHA